MALSKVGVFRYPILLNWLLTINRSRVIVPTLPMDRADYVKERGYHEESFAFQRGFLVLDKFDHFLRIII